MNLVWDENPKKDEWDHRTCESQKDFWDSNPEFGPPFGDVVAENSCGMAHNRFEPVSGAPFENAEMLQPLLVADTYCPTDCPKSPGVRLAAMALLLDVEASATAAAAAAGCCACCACR